MFRSVMHCDTMCRTANILVDTSLYLTEQSSPKSEDVLITDANILVMATNILIRNSQDIQVVGANILVTTAKISGFLRNRAR